jgi:class 3 adenylate cyclase
MTRVCYHRQSPAREVNPEISPELSNFIDHLLEKDPRRRPQGAEEVSAVLDSLAGIAPLQPALHYLLWPTESMVMDSAALSDSTADIPRFLPKSILTRDDLRTSIFIWTVLATDLANAADLLRRCGDEPASRILLQYDRKVRDLLAQFAGFEIDKANGFVLLFRRPIDAVRFALTLKRRLAELARETEVDLDARVGIHVGEVHLRENPAGDVERGAKRFEAEGRTKAIATKVLHAARPGQILITQGVYELARLAKLDLDGSENLVWQEHSKQDVEGLDETVSIFEVVHADPLTLERHGSDPGAGGSAARRPRRIVLMVAALLAALAAVLLSLL